MRNKTVHLLALFLMIYIGVEVTIGGKLYFFLSTNTHTHTHTSLNYSKSGWIVTFLMLVRGGGPSTGYVSTGFFGGKYIYNSNLFISLYVEPFSSLRSYFRSCGLSQCN